MGSIAPHAEQTAETAPHGSEGRAADGRETRHLRVDGMVCAGCAAAVQQALEQAPGVARATVSVTDARATVLGDHLDIAGLVRAIESRGFKAEEEAEELAPSELRSEIELRQQRNERAWRFRAVVALSIWVPLESLHWTAHALHWHGMWMGWLMLIGASIAFATAGAGFYQSAWNAARRRTTNMDTLIAIGSTAAFVFSLVVFTGHHFGRLADQPLYFAEAVALLGIISLGHWLEARAASRASSAVRELLELQPDEAEVYVDTSDRRNVAVNRTVTVRVARTSKANLGTQDSELRTVPSADVVPGDRLLIRPGARVPVDGRIVEGASEVDEAVVTGEPLPVRKGVGDFAVAGSMNTTGRLVVEATVDGRHTTVTRIADLVRDAQSSKADIQRLADRVCAVFVPTVLTIAVVTFLGWSLLAGLPVIGLIAAVTVLIISCPCALGLATPMAVMVGAGAASKRGILIKSAAALERASRITHVVFDKTGTLTAGAPVVAAIEVSTVRDREGDAASGNGGLSRIREDDVLRLAASVEAPSEHPIARAIGAAAAQRGLTLDPIEDFQAMPGEGVRGRIGGSVIQVVRDDRATCRVIVDDQTLGTISVTDEIRPDARRAIERLREMGLHVSMLSGDRRHVAEAIGCELGLEPEDVIAEATPEDKTEYIRSFSEGVIMVGDGINDAAALAEADLGIAMASGTNIAIESADVVIPSDRVESVPETIELARQTLRTIKQNLFLAFVYNTCAIPAAAFYLLGMRGPLIAAAAMGASDISVIGNALRLKRRLSRRR